MKLFCLGLLIAGLVQHAQAAEVVINVSGISSTEGQVGCLIFDQADGFPKSVDKALKRKSLLAASAVTCTFANLRAGTYAIAVSHDKNNNEKLDTNFLGVPKEAWGVSNNVRFKLRPPKYEEAQFSLTENQKLTMSIEVAI